MSVVSVGEAADSPKGGLGWKGDKFERIFYVRVDSFDDGPIVVLAADDLPKRTNLYFFGGAVPEEHRFCICKDVKAERIGMRQLVWKVTCSYETIETSGNAMDVDQAIAAWQDPLLEVADVKIKNEIYQEPVWGGVLSGEDYTGVDKKQITNSAGVIISPPFMRDKTRQIITISRLEDIDQHDTIFQRSLDYENTINSDFWWFAPPHSAKINPFDMERVSRSVGETGELKLYLKVTYTIYIQWPDWDIRPLDAGAQWNDKSVTPNKLRACTTQEGHTFKALLNGSGQPLAGLDSNNRCIPVPDTTEPVFLGPVQIYEEKTFADLNLPESILGV